MFYILINFLFFSIVSSHGDMNGDRMHHALYMHNNLRANNTVVPAANMIELTWNNFLQQEAANLAETCVFAHSTNGYGQNLYRTSRLDVDDAIHNGIQAFIDEIDAYRDQILNAPVDRIGVGIYDHASQILWAKTSELGCSYNQCQFGIYLVCNYLEAGNFLGRPWFEGGQPCSNCPDSHPFCNGNLCSAVEPIIITLPPPTVAPTLAPTVAPTVAPTLEPTVPLTIVPSPSLPICTLPPAPMTKIVYIPIEIPRDHNTNIQDIISQFVCPNNSTIQIDDIVVPSSFRSNSANKKNIINILLLVLLPLILYI